MKIAFLLGSLNRGGTETLMLDVCKSLKKDDFEAIGIYRKDGILENEFQNTGICFYKLAPGKNIPGYLWRLRKLIVKNKIDIVHAQQPIDALFAKIACAGTGIKTILTLHGFDSNFQYEKDKLLNFILKKTNRNIYVSNYQKEYYKVKYSLDEKKQTVVYNGISFEKLDKKPPAVNIRKELNIPAGTLLLGMVGNFNEVRDQFTIVRFLNLLKQSNTDFHFIFVGKKIDNLAERYDKCVEFCEQNQFADKVSFLGVRNDVPQILSFLDAFIYSTEQDTFGIAVVEAMALGIPVFVNDWVVMNEISLQGKYATIYKTKDETDLYDKFMLFLQEKESVKADSNKNISFIREKFAIQNHINNLKQLYTDIHNS